MSHPVESGDIKESLVEDENKINIETTSINFGCVKSEPNAEPPDFEEYCHSKRSRITLEYENIFGEPSHQRKIEEDYGNLIGFLDNDIIMENLMIKLEAIKEEKDESVNNLYCSKCKGIYKGYCLKCSTLLHILNNNLAIVRSESELNTIPTYILEIRETSRGKGVYVLRTLPINIIFGPFEGILGIESRVGHSWKIIDNKLRNIESGNWMKNIGCAASASFKNLDIIQVDGKLYFQSNREITEGEELLIYYDDEKLQQLNNSEECLYTPQKQEKLPKIFACSMCCLGFGSIKCLMEHKRKCLMVEHSRSMKDFELVECHCCKIWLEKQEYQEYHMGYCSEKYLRMSYRHSQPVDRTEVKVEEIEDGLNIKAVHGGLKCSQCVYETNYEKDLQKHLNTHKKPVQCDICNLKLTQKQSLERHIKNKHTEDGCAKDYQCSECTYQTNGKHNYQLHLNRHRGIKPFKCDICGMKFTEKQYLKKHIKRKHTENRCAKVNHCPRCSFQTNYKSSFKRHLNTHRCIKPFQCDICLMKFTQKSSLERHIKNKHTEDGCAKDYQCSECTYQTNGKHNYQLHLNRHRGIKPFKCDICGMKFTEKQYLKKHIKRKHTENRCAKVYHCPQCSFRTNYKSSFKMHLNKHSGTKPFQCCICMMRFTQKEYLAKHIKNKHIEDGCAHYQCSECCFQTNYKSSFKRHLNTHSGTKPFQCCICMMRFIQKEYLAKHIKNKHTEDGCVKVYDCPQCSFQTNYKSSFKRHLNTHRGIKPFQCDICLMKFTQKSSLVKHIKNKHTEDGCARDYQCSECTYQTNRKYDYQAHLNRHRGIKPFECGICKMKFIEKQYLKKHIKRKHTENRCDRNVLFKQIT